MQDIPYFMENEEWYYFDEKKWRYFLTDKAPQKAIDSYNEFYDSEAKDGKGFPIIVD